MKTLLLLISLVAIAVAQAPSTVVVQPLADITGDASAHQLQNTSGGKHHARPQITGNLFVDLHNAIADMRSIAERGMHGGGGSSIDLSAYHFITMRIQVVTTGSPVFNYVLGDPGNTCVSPAKVRLFLEHVNDDYVTDTFRFWANPIAYTLAAGQADVTVALTPDQWSSVYGHFGTEVLSGWQDTLSHIGNVGMTFGGGCYFGHGVNVSGGTAQFLLLGYTIS